jgi:penicillin-binding protein 2
MARSISFNDPLRERQSFGARVALLFTIAVLLIAVLVTRLVQLQVWEFETYQTRSDENRIQVQPLAPPRGLIYDRNGVLLADNTTIYSLALVRERVDDMEALLARLNQLVGLDAEELEGYERRLKRRRRPFEPVTLKEILSEAEIARLAVERHRLPGVEIVTELVRRYPANSASLFAHAVGSVRRVTEEDLQRLDPVSYSATRYLGRRGVERFYENSLHGQVGYQQVETDAHGRIRQVLEINPPVSGKDITLHLDHRLQIAASAALGGRRGAVVALDPRSGGVLAMVSNPGYDPNLFISGMTGETYSALLNSRDKPLFNRAINGQYAPGSTFKPIVGLAGIASGETNWSEHIEDKGWFKLPNQERIYRDWSWTARNSGGQGVVNLNRAIYRSSNVYFYDLASRIGIARLAPFAAQFGLGQNLAEDISLASSGLLPDPIWKQGVKGQVWYPGDTVNLGIGQGDLLVTPLQLATVSAILANRGRVVRPRMLLESNRALVELDPLPAPEPVQGLSPEDWELMVDSMEDVVHRGNKGYGQNGTAWAYIGRGIDYRMAGKSGTAQVVEIRQGEEYDEEELDEFNRKHAWFIAFAPADNPVIALAVLVENGGGGSSVAGPVAREVLDAYLLPQLAAK